MATFAWSGAYSGSWAKASNWVNLADGTAGPPADGDTVYFRNNSVNLDSDLDQSATELAALYIESTYTGQIGSSAAYLIINADVAEIGNQTGTAGQGSSMLKIDMGDYQTAMRVYSTSNASASFTQPPVRLLFSNSSSTLEVRSGHVGVASSEGETSTLSSITAGYLGDSATSNVAVTVGKACTVTNYYNASGINSFYGLSTNLYCNGGIMYLDTTDSFTTVTCKDGTMQMIRFGSINALTAQDKGVVDFTKSNQSSVSLTNTIDIGGTIKTNALMATTFTPAKRMRIAALAV